MTARSKTRPFASILLILCLWAPTLTIAAGRDLHRTTELRAVAGPPSPVLITRTDAEHELARRPSAPCVFTLVRLNRDGSDPGHRAMTVERHARLLLWAAGPRTGRSPPAIS
jgi:hypothetical protein